MTTAQFETIYDPSPDDPSIIGAIDAQKRLEAAMMSADVPAVEALTAPDVVVHAPINMVVTRENVIGRLRSGQISYDTVERTLAFAGVRGETVVLMGEEVVTPNRDAPNAGKIVHRRFTDIWANVAGAWMLTVRHATNVSVQ